MSESRLHDTIILDINVVNILLEPYGLHAISFETLRGGLINTNIKVMTSEGTYLLRIYIPERTEPNIQFEMSILDRLSNSHLPVQKPVISNRGAVGIYQDRHYVLLEWAHGSPMGEDELTDGMAKDIGKFVADMHIATKDFIPNGNKPDADPPFIHGELNRLHKNWNSSPKYNNIRGIWNIIYDYFNSNNFTKGVVHADIYPGNVITDDSGRLTAVLDFDDSYFGTQLFDLTIAMMAFSFEGPTVPNWKRAKVVFDTYASEIVSSGELDSLQHKYMPDQLYFGIILNCFRFYIYTLPLTIADGMEFTENPFFQRIMYLASKDGVDSYEEVFFADHKEIPRTLAISDLYKNRTGSGETIG